MREARFDDAVGRRIQDWSTDQFDDEIGAALEEFVGPERVMDDADVQIFATWFHQDRELAGGGTPAERYADRRGRAGGRTGSGVSDRRGAARPLPGARGRAGSLSGVGGSLRRDARRGEESARLARGGPLGHPARPRHGGRAAELLGSDADLRAVRGARAPRRAGAARRVAGRRPGRAGARDDVPPACARADAVHAAEPERRAELLHARGRSGRVRIGDLGRARRCRRRREDPRARRAAAGRAARARHHRSARSPRRGSVRRCRRARSFWSRALSARWTRFRSRRCASKAASFTRRRCPSNGSRRRSRSWPPTSASSSSSGGRDVMSVDEALAARGAKRRDPAAHRVDARRTAARRRAGDRADAQVARRAPSAPRRPHAARGRRGCGSGEGRPPAAPDRERRRAGPSPRRAGAWTSRGYGSELGLSDELAA